jgi:lysophospholipase L1-like esterase
MNLSHRLAPIAFLVGLIVAANPLVLRSQSISIKKIDGNYVVEAATTPGTPAMLQVSHNLRLWVDVGQDAQDQYSVPVQAAGESIRYYRLVPLPEPAPEIRIMIVGDSMASDCCGWGQGVPQYVKGNALVINYAQAWMSSKVFLQSTEYDRMLLVQPNYVLINFAYSDGGLDPSRQASPAEFKENLRTIIQAVRSFNGVPILVTLHAGRYFDAEGHLDPNEHPYNAFTREISVEQNTPLIDFFKITWDLCNKLGPEGSAFINWNPDDKMHTSPLGAQYFSRLLLRDMPTNLGTYFKGIYDPPPQP